MSNTETKEKRRTTLTLEPDVNREILRRLRKNPALKEKALINELLRRGIDASETSEVQKAITIKPFKTQRVAGVTNIQIEEMLKEI